MKMWPWWPRSAPLSAAAPDTEYPLKHRLVVAVANAQATLTVFVGAAGLVLLLGGLSRGATLASQTQCLAKATDAAAIRACRKLPTRPGDQEEPSPCAGSRLPCRSLVFGPYVSFSTAGDLPGSVKTVVKHEDGAEFVFTWIPVGSSVNLLVSGSGVPTSTSIELDDKVPSLGQANFLAAVLLGLDAAGDAATQGASANATELVPIPDPKPLCGDRRPRNHAGCDVLDDWFRLSVPGSSSCGDHGSCCDEHDACIADQCSGPDDSGNVLVCLVKPFLPPFKPCSPACERCHKAVRKCFTGPPVGSSGCCTRSCPPGREALCCPGEGDCQLLQQCLIGDAVETDPCTCERFGESSVDACADGIPVWPGDSWGDPHLVTFDRLAYDFQAVGEFVLVTADDRKLQVQVRSSPWQGSRVVSVNTAVAVNVGGDRVGVYVAPRLRVVLNGTEVQAPESMVLPNGGRLASGVGTYTISWPDGSKVIVSTHSAYLDVKVLLAGGYAKTTSGLLGNFDSVLANDLVPRGGGLALPGNPTYEQLYTEYGGSWRVRQVESLFDYENGETTETYSDETFPDRAVGVESLSADARAAAEEICRRAGITEPVLLRACILDVALTGDASFASSSVDATSPDGTTIVDGRLKVEIFPFSSVEEGPDGLTFSNSLGSLYASEISFGSETGFNWHPFGLADFGAQITGSLVVSESGSYTLTVSSDDAAYVFVDGNLVVSEPGAHGAFPKSGSVFLSAGNHRIEVQFYECCGGPSGIDLPLPDGVEFR